MQAWWIINHVWLNIIQKWNQTWTKMFVNLASQFGNCVGVAVHVFALLYGSQMLAVFPLCVFFFSLSFWVLWCQLESFPLPLQWTGETQWVRIVLLSSNFLPQTQRFGWQASSILCADLLLMQQKENPMLWLHRHLMLLSVLACKWVKSCTAPCADPERAGQGGTSSSNGSRDATFMLPNWDSSRSCIHSGLYGSFSILREVKVLQCQV